MSGLRTEVVGDAAALESLREGWDELAVLRGHPLSAPAWLLTWWRTMAPPDAVPRVVVVREGGEMIGIAPYCCRRERGMAVYGPIGRGMANRNTPLARPGRDGEVSEAVAAALARAQPRPAIVRFDQIDVSSPWPTALRRAWPGPRPGLDYERTARAPTLTLGDISYDEWLASKSSNFRQRLRRDARKLESRGARTHRVEDPADLARVMAAFGRLHGTRWGEGSKLTGPAHELLLQAGRELLPSGRFRAYVIETDDEVVTVQLFVAAGGEVAYWNGGWNPDWAPLTPAMQGIVAGVKDAYERRERRIDFGEGDHHYKDRLADDDQRVTFPRLYPVGPTYPVARGIALGARARAQAARLVARLPPGVRRRIDRMRGRLPS